MKEKFYNTVVRAIYCLAKKNEGVTSFTKVENYLIAENEMENNTHADLTEVMRYLFDKKIIKPEKRPKISIALRFVPKKKFASWLKDHYDSLQDNFNDNVTKTIYDRVVANGFTSLRDVEKHLMNEEKMEKSQRKDLMEIIGRLYDENKISPIKKQSIPNHMKFHLNQNHSLWKKGYNCSKDENGSEKSPRTAKKKKTNRIEKNPKPNIFESDYDSDIPMEIFS